MRSFRDKVAIVTGGASGIGRALGEELVRDGARVVLADVNADGVERAAGEMSAAEGAAVDVTDAAAVGRLVEDTAARHGRLDYVFNNAGIAILGHARLMTLADWNRLIDVNVRGVLHGIAAAYPLMIRQGFGHIVNTASAAGLLPTPGGTGYALTKHAVVGLSVSLREEAASFGVKVSVVCPGFIDTPIKDAARVLGADKNAVMESIPVGLYPARSCARDALRGVARNRAIIVVTTPAKLAWLLYRFAPGLAARFMRLQVTRNPLLAQARNER